MVRQGAGEVEGVVCEVGEEVGAEVVAVVGVVVGVSKVILLMTAERCVSSQ